MAPVSDNSQQQIDLVSPKIFNFITQLKSQEIVWKNLIYFVVLHLSALYGVYLMLFRVQVLTILWSYLLFITNAKGITCGAHRLWSHRSYKARLPLRCFLAMANSLGFQNSIFEWSRDHRLHHKYSETDADPHNAKRGFFFAHMGWLMMRKHPDVIKHGRLIDMTDLLNDPVVRFQKKYYLPSVILMCFVIPTFIPNVLWNESLPNAFFVSSILRYVLFLHFTWLVNSAAHMWGDKPYNTSINPADSRLVSNLSAGEGYHNYHHTFPWDYRASEWGWKKNISGIFIDMWASIGLAYDLKKVPQEIVDKRRKNNGDQSTPWFDEDSARMHLKGL